MWRKKKTGISDVFGRLYLSGMGVGSDSLCVCVYPGDAIASH